MSLPEKSPSLRQNKYLAFHNGHLLPDLTLAWIVDTALHSAAQRELRVYPTQTLTEALDACVRVTHKYAQIFDYVGRCQKAAA